jgi:hypothetical protein
MEAREGITIAAVAIRAIEAGGLTAAQAQQYINQLTPYLIYKNKAADFQITIDRLRAVVAAGGDPVVPPPANAVPPEPINPQVARVENAVRQNPGGNATVSLSQSIVQPAVIPTDRGLDPPTLPLIKSQATPRTNVAALVEGGLDPQQALDVAAGIATPTTQAGVGARNDDAPPVTGNSTKDIINATFATGTNSRIVPRANVLDDYASYTYQISWYLLTPQQYNNLIFSPKFDLPNWSLLMQSGGAPLPATSNTSQPTNLPGRSPFFPLDYYIDDLELLSKFPGKGVGMPHNVLDIKFKVTEPNGITLIDNLYAAVDSLYRKPRSLTDESDSLFNTSLTLTPNYITAQYCLAVKFYGYDSGGNLIAPATGSNTPRSNSVVGPSNDPRAVIQKYYPFVITELKFRVQSKLVEYYVEGKPVSLNHAFGQSRGTIPFNFELSGTTVKDLLIGKPAQEGLKPRQDGRVPQTQPAKAGPPPAAAATINAPNSGADALNAGFDDLGNFTGTGSPLNVGA